MTSSALDRFVSGQPWENFQLNHPGFAFLVAARFADPIISLLPYQFARDWRRVRELIDTYAAQGVRFFAPDVAFADAEKYMPALLKKRGKADDLSGALSYL